MALRSQHGTSSALVRVETVPIRDQPQGLPQAPAGDPTPEPAGERDGKGRFVAGARTQQRRGALAANTRGKQLRTLSGLGLLGAQPEALRPFLEAADEFCKAEIERQARDCGAGVCPANSCALIQQASLAMAASRAAYAQGDTAAGAKFGVEVRQMLLGSRELTVLEAKSRATLPGALDPVAAMRARIIAMGQGQ